MDNAIITTLISTSGAVIVGLGGMWISTNQIGKRIDSIERRFERLEDKIGAFEEEFRAFRDVVIGKFTALDMEIAKLMDQRG